MSLKTLHCLVLFAAFYLVLLPGAALSSPKALSLADVETWLKNGISNERITKLVGTRGVSSDPMSLRQGN